MTDLYDLLCWAAAGACLIAGIAGAAAFRGGFAHPFAWRAIRAAQLLTVIAAAVGTALIAGLGKPGSELAYGYSMMAAAVSFGAEQLRLASAATVLSQHGLSGSDDVAGLATPDQDRLARQIALRELGVETVAMFVCVALLLRGAGAY